MKTIKTLQAALVAAIVAMAAGCANDPLIDPTTPDTPQGKPMTITVNMPADNAQTRVAFDGSDLSLKWQTGDKLTVKRNNQSEEFTIDDSSIRNGGKSASFSGTDPDNGGRGNYTITYAGTNMTEQKQTTNGNTGHLKERIYLEATAAKLTDNFTLAMKSSIMKFVLSGTKLGDIGDLRYLTWRAEGTTQMNSSILCIDGCTFDSNTLTAYMGFMPQDMTIKAGGRFIVELMGSSKTYKAEVTIAAGKTYDAGSQYTATINGTATTAQWEEAPSNVMKFTVKVDDTNGLDFRVPFNTSGTTPADITVDWGDGKQPLVVAVGTTLDDNTTFDHRYTTAGTYQITITSGQVDPTQQQIPKLDFTYRSTNNNKKKLISMDTPLLCTDGLYFNNIFQNCISLTSVPAGLFDKNIQVTQFGNCFDNCTSLTSVPAGLFDRNTEVTSFYYCFNRCTSLTSVPKGLFDKNTKVTSFQSCFSGCTMLSSVPAGLFDKNTEVTDFRNCFNYCTSLTSVPTGLFDKNTLATDFEHCFSGCTSLVLNEHIFSVTANKDRFKDMDMNLRFCFYNVGGNLTPEQKAKSKAPDLWNYNMGTVNWARSDCYTGCNASNDWTGIDTIVWGRPSTN